MRQSASCIKEAYGDSGGWAGESTGRYHNNGTLNASEPGSTNRYYLSRTRQRAAVKENNRKAAIGSAERDGEGV